MTPVVMLWPQMNEDMSILFWLTESIFLLEIVRKLAFDADEGADAYEVALAYIKSNFAIDVVATLP